jgi:hypothetical protein
MLVELKGRGTWFPTASQAVSWFRKRRSCRLTAVQTDNGALKIKAELNGCGDTPGLKLRIHKPGTRHLRDAGRESAKVEFVDVPFSQSLETTITV